MFLMWQRTKLARKKKRSNRCVLTKSICKVIQKLHCYWHSVENICVWQRKVISCSIAEWNVSRAVEHTHTRDEESGYSPARVFQKGRPWQRSLSSCEEELSVGLAEGWLLVIDDGCEDGCSPQAIILNFQYKPLNNLLCKSKINENIGQHSIATPEIYCSSSSPRLRV